jgi:RNA polymerase sigma factor (sigma-70 family)
VGDRRETDDTVVVGELYAGCYRRLVTRLYAFTGDLSDAEEVVQEAFVRALAAPRRFRGVDNPEAWLFRVAVNVARTRLRRRQVLDRLLRRVGPPPILPDRGADHLALMAALRRLPPGQRYALALHYLSDLPIDDVASVLNASEGTVKSRLSRGRVALATLVADWHGNGSNDRGSNDNGSNDRGSNDDGSNDDGELAHIGGDHV